MRGVLVGLMVLGAAGPARSDYPLTPQPPAVPRLSDGFEADRIAPFWLPSHYGSGLHVPGSVSISTEQARSGTRSARLVLREGNVDAMGDDGQHVERTEIDSGHHPLLGADVYYGFSEMIPTGFPIVPTRLVIAQVKQSDVEGSPLIGQRFVAGVHYLTIRPPGASGSGRKYPLPPIRPGRWFDMVYHVRYSEGDDGLIEVWMDGVLVVLHQGPTASKTAANRFYHKVGLYRDRMAEPMTIFVDNYAVGPSREAVDPARFADRREPAPAR